jgi:murein DD-endopeptidase MepM/ murein hydrolase activator NlpD
LHETFAGWYTSTVPRDRRGSNPSRFLLPGLVGGLVLAAFGPVVVGTIFPPSPAGAVEGTSRLASSNQSADQLPALVALPAPGALSPRSAGSPPPGGSLDERAEAAAPRPAPLSELSGYQWPLPHARITLPFGPSKWGSRVVDGEAFHDGVDMATFCGDRIVAAHDGVVLAAGRHYDIRMGWIGDLKPYLDRLDARSLWSTLPIVIVIDDGDGYRSIYAHLSKTVVEVGQSVSAGEFLGYEGKTGRASGCHLHFGLFSPLESARFGIDPAVVEHMKLPAWQTARVDPLLVLPQRSQAKPKPSAKAPQPDVGAAQPPLE